MTRIDRNDFNQDGVVNHDDVEFFIHEVESGGHGSMSKLLQFQKDGGELNAQDIKDLIQAGGKVDGSDIARYVQQGGKLTQEDITALQKAGVDFTPNEMASIQSKLGLPLCKFAPGTTVADLMEMRKAGVKITAEDLASLKGSDGKPLATMDDFLGLMEDDVTVKAEDLIAFQQAGGKLTPDDLARFVEKGGKLKADDLAALSKGGTRFTVDQLAGIAKQGHLKLTMEDFVAINPISDKTGKPYYEKAGDPVKPSDLIDMVKMGIKVSGLDLRSLKGPDGKPLATEQDLIDFVAAGGKLKGADLVVLREEGLKFSEDTLIKLVDGGVDLSKDDLVSLAKSGLVFTDSQLIHITKECKIPLSKDDFIAINPVSSKTGERRFGTPPVAKPSDLVDMARLDIKVSGQDLIACKNPPPTASDLVAFAQAGGKLSGADVIALQRSGVKISGDDMVDLVSNGVKFDSADIVDLSAGGAEIWQDDLDWMLEKLGVSLTNEQWHKVNPIEVKSEKPMYG
jgi:hypothetical protein